MEEIVVQRLIEAAERAEEDSGWSIKVRPAGIRIAYTWQYVTFHPFTNRPMLPGNFYTVENITGWGDVERAHANPLLIAMDDLMQQKKDHHP